MVYSFKNKEDGVKKAPELIKKPDLKQEWQKKREKLLKDKIDVTKFMVDFIENYPASFREYENSNLKKYQNVS